MRCIALVLLWAVLLGGCCELPHYTPGFWNRDSAIRSSNNCYNYGNNKRTDSYAQPGKGAGIDSYNYLCAEVATAAIADGIKKAHPSMNCPGDEDILALFVDPDIDYHWYRRDNNGMWSHKPGGSSATNLDNSGKPITNPETADRCEGDPFGLCYSEFCGYFCSCSSNVEGRGNEMIK